MGSDCVFPAHRRCSQALQTALLHGSGTRFPWRCTFAFCRAFTFSRATLQKLELTLCWPGYSKFQQIWGWMCDPHLAVCHKVKIVPLCVRVFLREAFLDLSSDAPNSQNECWSQSTFSWVQREKSGSGHTECLLSRGLGWPAKLDASLTWRAGVRGFHRGAHRVQRAYARRGSRARDPTCVSARSPTFSLPRVSGAYLRVLCFLQKYTAIHSINVLL